MSDTSELTLDTLRASIGSVNGIATTAYDIASNASLSVQDAQHKIARLETQVMVLKLQVDNLVKNAEARALQSQTTASAANNTAAAALAKVTEQTKQIQALQAQVNALLTPAQVNDLVWSKVWDANYQIRMGFLAGRSAIQQVQDYLNDLAVYIRNVTGK